MDVCLGFRDDFVKIVNALRDRFQIGNIEKQENIFVPLDCGYEFRDCPHSLLPPLVYWDF